MVFHPRSSGVLHPSSPAGRTVKSWMCWGRCCRSSGSRAPSTARSASGHRSGSPLPNRDCAACTSSSRASARFPCRVGPPRRLRAGDLVLFPRGDAHVLHSVGSVRGPTQSGVALAMATERGIDVRGGGAGAETVILCGAFVVTRHDHPALAALPEIVHVTEGSGRERWLAPYVDALSAEVFHGGPGSGVVMTRLSDALVARALRFHVESVQEPGLLLGLGDPYVAPGPGRDPRRPGRSVDGRFARGLGRGVAGGVRRALSAAGGDLAGWLSAAGPDGAGRALCCATNARRSGRWRRRWDMGPRRRSPRRSSATPARPRALTGRPRCRRSARAGRRGGRRARCSMPESPCW